MLRALVDEGGDDVVDDCVRLRSHLVVVCVLDGVGHEEAAHVGQAER